MAVGSQDLAIKVDLSCVSDTGRAITSLLLRSVFPESDSCPECGVYFFDRSIGGLD
jgi:hypothetical protein